MLAGLLITIPQGLEAFFITGMLLGYRSKLGRRDLGAACRAARSPA